MPASFFRFAIPSLPKEWYVALQESCHAHKLSQWQIVILGLACLKILGQQSPGQVESLVQEILTRYPVVTREAPPTTRE